MLVLALYTDIFTRVYPAQPVAVPVPAKDKSSCVDKLRDETHCRYSKRWFGPSKEKSSVSNLRHRPIAQIQEKVIWP